MRQQAGLTLQTAIEAAFEETDVDAERPQKFAVKYGVDAFQNQRRLAQP